MACIWRTLSLHSLQGNLDTLYLKRWNSHLLLTILPVRFWIVMWRAQLLLLYAALTSGWAKGDWVKQHAQCRRRKCDKMTKSACTGTHCSKVYVYYDHHCKQAGGHVVFVKVFFFLFLLFFYSVWQYRILRLRHSAFWDGCSHTWLIRNIRFGSIGVPMPCEEG